MTLHAITLVNSGPVTDLLFLLSITYQRNVVIYVPTAAIKPGHMHHQAATGPSFVLEGDPRFRLTFFRK